MCSLLLLWVPNLVQNIKTIYKLFDKIMPFKDFCNLMGQEDTFYKY